MMEKPHFTADNYFAQIPEWVMYSRISKSAILVYLVLQRYSNSVTHECWPSRETISAKADISLATVDKCLKELEQIEAIQIVRRKKGPGMNSSNLYRLITAMPKWAWDQLTNEKSVVTKNGATKSMPLDPTLSRGLVATKSMTQTIEENHRRRTITKNALTVAEQQMFDQFWAVFPKHDDPEPSKRAFKKALLKASFEEIMEGAKWYADFRQDQDPQYTKIAKNWLGECSWGNRPIKSSKSGTFREREIDFVKQAMQRIKEAPRELR